MDVRLHHVRPGEAGLLDRLAPDVFDNPIVPRQLEAFLADPRHVLVVAIAGDVVIGMATAVEYFHPDKQPQLWINELGVAPEHQRQGHGRRLLAALLAIGRERGCECAWLGTEPDNAAANACYRGLPDGEPAETFLLYEWDLTE